MTNNIDRAAEVLYNEGVGSGDTGYYLAHRLVDAGLLASGTIEYRVEHQHIDGGVWHPVTEWSPEWPFHEGYYKADDERVVCRRVSEPWEVTNE